MNKLIFDAKTSAATSDRISIYAEKLPVTFGVVGMSPGEEITVEFQVNGIWESLFVAGSQAKLTSSNKVISVYSPFPIRLTKGLTDNPVSVEMFSQNIESAS